MYLLPPVSWRYTGVFLHREADRSFPVFGVAG